MLVAELTPWGYQKQGPVAEVTSVDRYGQVATDHIAFEVLAERPDTFSPGDRPYLPQPHARGYQQFEPGGPLVDTTAFNPTVACAAGDMVTTAADLTRFWRALQDGELLGAEQLAEMRRTVLAETFQDYLPGARYGLGIMWIPSSCGGYWSHGATCRA